MQPPNIPPDTTCSVLTDNEAIAPKVVNLILRYTLKRFCYYRSHDSPRIVQRYTWNRLEG